jgi:hypothetical protein
MRPARIALFSSLLLFSVSLRSQQTPQIQPTASAQGVVLLQQAVGTLAGSTTLADVTLTGAARRIVGSDDETGTVVLEALATGQTQLKFSYPSGQRSELTSFSTSGTPVGSWAGPDGVSHAMSQHNLWTDSSWFFPALTLSKLLASQTSAVTLAGQENKDGVAVTHLTAFQQFPDVPADMAQLMQHVSQMDIFLDTKTLLPVVLDFNVHPDDNMLLDIPVEIRVSDYRAVNGVQAPFHIQKYLNNSLILDIQVQTATLNSGLAASAFSAQ